MNEKKGKFAIFLPSNTIVLDDVTTAEAYRKYAEEMLKLSKKDRAKIRLREITDGCSIPVDLKEIATLP